jgi:hypothetical protein
MHDGELVHHGLLLSFLREVHEVSKVILCVVLILLSWDLVALVHLLLLLLLVVVFLVLLHLHFGAGGAS